MLRGKLGPQRWVGVAMAIMLIAPVAAFATGGAAGAVNGRVLDQAGAQVASVDVLLVARTGGHTVRSQTDDQGRFAFEKVPAGGYIIIAHKAGLKQSSQLIEVTEGSNASTALTLETAAGPATPPRSEVEQLRSEVEQLRALVEALAKERQPAAPRTQAAALQPETTQEPKPESSQEPKPPSGQEAQEKSLPGRGKTDQGLYGTTAAGDQNARYGRGIFGDSLRIGGYGSFRFETNDLDKLPRVGNLPVARHDSNGFDIRRLVLTADVSPSERLRLYTELEFERFAKLEIERTAIPENRGGQSPIAGTRFIQEVEGQDGSELKLEQFWAQYNLTKNVGIRGGIILPPVGRFNILHDDDYWDIPRRTLIDRDAPALPVKTAWSEAGLGLIGSSPIGKGFINYQFYVVNGVTLDYAIEQTVAVRDDKAKIEFEPEIFFDSGAVNGSRPVNALTWRVGLSPRVGNEIAFSGYHGKYTPKFLQTSAYINTLGVDGKLTVGSFEAEGEFIYTRFGKLRQVLSDLARNLVNSEGEDELNETETEVAVGLKGPFTDRRHGFWVDLKYRARPGWLKRSWLGESFSDPQLIPILRYERVWYKDLVREFGFRNSVVDEFELESLSQDRVTLGLTYRPISSVPISIAYQRNQRRSGSTLIFPDTLGLGRPSDRSFNSLMIGIAFGF
jgi:hypothetical protein